MSARARLASVVSRCRHCGVARGGFLRFPVELGRNMSPRGRGLRLQMSNALVRHGTDRDGVSTEEGVG